MNRKKLVAVISAVIVVILAGLLTWFVYSWLRSFSQEGFREYIRSFGFAGWAVLLGLQFLQVFVALIPGELLETAAGYCFGPLVGTVICYLGVGLASCLVFLLTRRFGVKLVELFVDREKLLQLRFLNTEKKRDMLIFVLFLLPGTPKDLLTYFVGLTDIKLTSFLVLSLIARFPSVISSTVGGHLLGQEDYTAALILYGITAAVSGVGLLVYNAIMKRRKSRD